MPKTYYQSVIQAVITTAREIARFDVVEPGDITKIRIQSDAAASGANAVFLVKVNGTTVQTVTIDSGNTFEVVTGISDAVVEGDVIETFTSTLPGSGIGGQLAVTIVVDDGNSFLDTTYRPVEAIGLALSDESTAITTGTAKITFRMPYAFNVTEVRANLNTASSSGAVQVDINEGGTSILSTKLTIDASERTSESAAAAPVISDATLADDAEITIDIDNAGTGAKGLKVWLIGNRI